jgi:rhodanese-related sulfurtransferase
MRKGYKALLDEAMAEVVTLPTADAIARHGDPTVVFVDLRDPRELDREGMVAGAFHAPRGMLEFWIDPEPPYHRKIFAEDRQFIFYCAAGWRSALAAKTAQDMGLSRVAHVEGGFEAWRANGEAPSQGHQGRQVMVLRAMSRSIGL